MKSGERWIRKTVSASGVMSRYLPYEIELVEYMGNDWWVTKDVRTQQEVGVSGKNIFKYYEKGESNG